MRLKKYVDLNLHHNGNPLFTLPAKNKFLTGLTLDLGNFVGSALDLDNFIGSALDLGNFVGSTLDLSYVDRVEFNCFGLSFDSCESGFITVFSKENSRYCLR